MVDYNIAQQAVSGDATAVRLVSFSGRSVQIKEERPQAEREVRLNQSQWGIAQLNLITTFAEAGSHFEVPKLAGRWVK